MSTTLETLEQVFASAFDLPEGTDFDGLRYREVDNWNSIGHMRMIAQLEEAFDIMLDTADIIDMSSFGKAKEILGKYGVEIGA